MTDRRAYALSLVAAPLMLLLSSLSLTAVYGENAQTLQSIADAPTRHYLFTLFGILGSMLLIPAGFGLARELRPHRAKAAVVSGLLMFVGASLALVDYGTELVKGQAGQLQGQQAVMTTLLDRIDKSAGVAVLLQVSGMAFLAGIIVLAVGLRRARLVPSWLSVGLIVGLFFNLFGFAASSVEILDASAALLVVTMGWSGRLLLWDKVEAAPLGVPVRV